MSKTAPTSPSRTPTPLVSFPTPASASKATLGPTRDSPFSHPDVPEDLDEAADDEPKDSASSDTLKVPRLKADGSNYAMWAFRMQNLLAQRRLLRVVGSAPPDKPDSATDEEKKKWVKAYQDFRRRNERAYLQISTCCEDEVVPLFWHTKSAKEAWECLQNKFAGSGQQSRGFLLRKIWRAIWVDTEDMQTQINEMRMHARRLETFSHLSDEDLAQAMLIALPPSYDTTITNLSERGNDVSSMAVANAILRTEEWRKEHGNELAMRAQAGGAPRFGSNAKSSNTSGKACSNPNCQKKVGHTLETCWAKGGGQEGGGPKKKKAKGKGKGKDESGSAKVADDDSGARMSSAWVAYTEDEAKVAGFGSKDSTKLSWLVDSGASAHMTQHRSLFRSYRPLSVKKRIYTANNSFILALGEGTVPIVVSANGKSTEVTLQKVLYVPQLAGNLISTTALIDQGISTLLSPDGAYIGTGKGMSLDAIQARPIRQGSLFLLQTEAPAVTRATMSVVESCEEEGEDLTYAFKAQRVANSVVSPTLWHRRLAHISPEAVLRMVKKEIVNGMKFTSAKLPPKPHVCDICLKGKQTREVIPAITSTRATEVLGRVFSDISEIGIKSRNGFQYYITFTDDYSRFTRVVLLKRKIDAYDAIVATVAAMENETGRRLKIFRSDGGPEYVSERTKEFMRSKGIKRELTNPDTPQENGVSERKNRTLNDKTRTSLHEFRVAAKHNLEHRENPLPTHLWEDAIRYALWVENRTPNQSLPPDKTPFELYFGNKPDLAPLRVFGCKALVYVPPKQRASKLDARSIEGFHIGFAEEKRAYRVYIPSRRKVVESRDVQFDEGEGEPERILVDDDEDGYVIGVDSDDDVDAEVDEEGGEGEKGAEGGVEVESSPTTEKVVDSGGDVDSEGDERGAVYVPKVPSKVNRPPPQNAARRSSRTTKAPVPDDDARYETTSYGKKNRGAANVAEVEEDGFAYMTRDFEYVKKMESPQASLWQEAMVNEISTQDAMDTYEEVPRPTDGDVLVLPSRWVYAEKRDASGAVVLHKARIVAKGYSEREGVDYTETWAPTPRKSHILALVVIATHYDWEIFQVDVKAAFLHGELEEVIYMEAPAGFPTKVPNGVWKLKKAIYGLKQAASCWYKKLKSGLGEMGLEPLTGSPCLFVSNDSMLASHVDDMLVCARNRGTRDRLLSDLAKRFTIHDLGDLSFYLGLLFDRDRATRIVTVSQERYINDILERHAMSDAIPATLPLKDGIKLNKLETPANPATLRTYQRMLGALMYAVISTRPDLAFAACYLSQYASAPGPEHLNALVDAFRYLAGTRDLKLIFDCAKPLELVGFSDAGHATDPIARRSISGYYFTLAGNPISWSARKQATIAISSTEAEYVACSEAGREAVELRRFLYSLNILSLSIPTIIHMDSKSAIQLALASPTADSPRTKHIDVRHHWIREKIQDGVFKLEWMKTDDLTADVFTKALARQKLEKFRDDLRLLRTESR